MRLPEVQGLEVKLSAAGADLKEYEDDSEDTRHLSSQAAHYVESVPSAEFSVMVSVDRRFRYAANTLVAYVYLDGKKAMGKFIEIPHYRYNTSLIISGAENCVNGQWRFQKFAFAELVTNDTKPEAGLKERLAKLGEISVKVFRVRKAETSHGTDPEFKSTVDAKGVPEKALKGRSISSRTTLSEGTPIMPVRFANVEYPWGTYPVATFTFMYRSHRDLQIEGIIPRSPSPVPLDERDPDSLTMEEMRELVRLQRQKIQDHTKVKKEKREREEEVDDEDESDVELTREGRKRQRKSTDSGIEVIDLSNGDDDEDDD